MQRVITAFSQDDAGDWVAHLACLHRQHVRHRPPLFPRPWVLTAEGRDAHVGAELDCPLCDRAEMPDGLHRARTAGPFDFASLPLGLRRIHEVADRTWALLRVLDGTAHLRVETSPPIERDLGAGDAQAVPPRVPHLLSLGEDAVVELDFLVG